MALDFPSRLSRTTADTVLAQLVEHPFVGFKVREFVLREVREALLGRTRVKTSLAELSTELALVEQLVTRAASTPVATEVTSEPILTQPGKAVKHDDAAVPEYFWDERILAPYRTSGPLAFLQSQAEDAWMAKAVRALTPIRSGALCYWRRKVRREFMVWWRGEKGRDHPANDPVRWQQFKAGLSAIDCACGATWWLWDAGSAPFYWRWPLEFLAEICDGLAPRFLANSPLPSYRRAQKLPHDPKIVSLIRDKMVKIVKRGYLEKGPVSSLLNYFAVPKGDNDVRMVFDGTKSGLNGALFAPWFALPTVDSMLRRLLPEHWCGDNDYGEMFYNFWLHEDLRRNAGVDLTELEWDGKGKKETAWYRWNRPAMGLRPAPYQAYQSVVRLKSIVMETRRDANHPLHWASVRLNLPGSEDYIPSEPWVAKLQSDGRMAIDVVLYVDDERFVGPDCE